MVCGPHSAWSPQTSPWTVRGSREVGARIRFDARHQGAPKYAHGGAVAAVLDDAMGYVGFLILKLFVTAHLEVDYRRPVLLDHEYAAIATVNEIDGRKIRLRSELRDSANDVIAESTGLFIEVDIAHFRP